MRADIRSRRGNALSGPGQCGMACLPRYGRKSSSDLGAHTGRNQSPATEAAPSPGASGKSEHQDDMHQREQEQTVGQWNVNKKPGLEHELKRVVVIESVLLPHECGDLFENQFFLLVKVPVQLLDSIQYPVRGPAHFEQMQSKVPLGFKEVL